MKICKNCNAAMDDNASFCPNCGTKADQQAEIRCPVCNSLMKEDEVYCTNCGAKRIANTAAGSIPSIREFYGKYANPNSKKAVMAVLITGIIFAVFNLIVCIAFEYPAGLIDVALILGLTLWFYFSLKKISAYCMLGYTVLSVIIGLMNGSFTGWLLVIWAIWAIKTADTINKEYQGFLGAKQSGGS